MKALFVHRGRRKYPGSDWTGRIARRLRDWLDRYLEAKETFRAAESGGISPEAKAVEVPTPRPESPAQAGARRPDAQLFEVGGGPPAHWLERVRAGAPQLLLHPDEGGTPWFVAGQPTHFPFENAPESTLHVPQADRFSSKTAGDKPVDRSDRTSVVETSPERQKGKANLSGFVKSFFARERRTPMTSSVEEPQPPAKARRFAPSASSPVNVDASGIVGRAHPASSPSMSGPDLKQGQKQSVKDQPAKAAPSISHAARKNSYRPPQADRSRPTFPEIPGVRASKKAAPLPAAEDLWPELHEQPVRPLPSTHFGHSAHRKPVPSPFSESSRSDSAAYRARELTPTSSTSEGMFARVQLPAAGREAGNRLAEVLPAEAQLTESFLDLWPELPPAPEQGPAELVRAMRHWERTARLDREQRGEF